MTNRDLKIACPSCHQVGGIRELIFGLPMGEPDKERFALGGCCPQRSPQNLDAYFAIGRAVSINNNATSQASDS